MNQFDQVRAAVQEAEQTLKAADSVAGNMAALLRGRLRNVPKWHLRVLKKELQQFNAITGQWKDQA